MARDIEAQIDRLKERNRRVEADKAWETSWARKCVIALFTYALSVVILSSIRAPEPFLNALIPTLGFLLSTATFGFAKGWWMANMYRR
ncbi:MAG: hypothetical protein V1827_04690 [Candidatus Micrarchaeota archaeon]